MYTEEHHVGSLIWNLNAINYYLLCSSSLAELSSSTSHVMRHLSSCYRHASGGFMRLEAVHACMSSHLGMRANMCFVCRAHLSRFLCKWLSFPELWHSTCNPPPLCCLTLSNLWPMSTWTFKIWHFSQKLSAGAPISTSIFFMSAGEIFKSVNRKGLQACFIAQTVNTHYHMPFDDHFYPNSCLLTYMSCGDHLLLLTAVQQHEHIHFLYKWAQLPLTAAVLVPYIYFCLVLQQRSFRNLFAEISRVGWHWQKTHRKNKITKTEIEARRALSSKRL